MANLPFLFLLLFCFFSFLLAIFLFLSLPSISFFHSSCLYYFFLISAVIRFIPLPSIIFYAFSFHSVLSFLFLLSPPFSFSSYFYSHHTFLFCLFSSFITFFLVYFYDTFPSLFPLFWLYSVVLRLSYLFPFLCFYAAPRCFPRFFLNLYLFFPISFSLKTYPEKKSSPIIVPPPSLRD